MLHHSEYTCEVIEEIIIFSKKRNNVVGIISINECAKYDLSKLIQRMMFEGESEKYVDYFSENKVKYFCLKAMEALAYLHSKNVYYGDMKPENLLIFKDYKVKLGDFGVLIKLPDNATDDY